MVKKLAIVLALGVFALATQAESCAESAKDLEKAGDDLERMTEPNPELDAQVRAIPVGSTYDEVVAELGKPDDKQEFHSASYDDVTVYYGQWQLSFSDDKLESKNRY